jgi:hypothetical protein
LTESYLLTAEFRGLFITKKISNQHFYLLPSFFFLPPIISKLQVRPCNNSAHKRVLKSRTGGCLSTWGSWTRAHIKTFPRRSFSSSCLLFCALAVLKNCYLFFGKHSGRRDKYSKTRIVSFQEFLLIAFLPSIEGRLFLEFFVLVSWRLIFLDIFGGWKRLKKLEFLDDWESWIFRGLIRMELLEVW